MATKQTTGRPTGKAPSPKIPADIIAELKGQEVVVMRARKDIAALKKLGLVTKELEEKLDWADEARKVLLSEFT